MNQEKLPGYSRILFKSSPRGLMLTELLIVIAVATVLFTAGIAALNPAKQFSRANDAKRKADLITIQSGLERYFAEKGDYPGSTTWCAQISSSTYPEVREALQNYMKTVPKDPKYANTTSDYYYWHFAPRQYRLYAVFEDTGNAEITPNALNSDGGSGCTGFNTAYNYRSGTGPALAGAPTPVNITAFTAGSYSLAYNGSTTLSWNVTGAVTSCTGSGGWSGSKTIPSSSASTGNLTTTTAFTLSCSGIGGSDSETITITVAPPTPVTITSFTASPVSPIIQGSATTLSWTVTGNITGCTGSNGWSGSKAFPSGTYPTGNLSSTTTYVLDCTGPGGNDQETLVVTVTPIITTACFTGSPPTGPGTILTTTAANTRNSLIGTIDANMTVREVAVYGVGPNVSYELRQSTSAGGVSGTILASGPLSSTADASGYYWATVPNIPMVTGTNGYYVLRYVQTTGSGTSYYTSTAGIDAGNFSCSKWSNSTSSTTTNGTFAVRLKYTLP